MKLSGVDPYVCLSLCPSHYSHAAMAGLLLSAVPARDIDRQPRPPDAQQHGAQQQIALCSKCASSVTLTADVGSWTSTCFPLFCRICGQNLVVACQLLPRVSMLAQYRGWSWPRVRPSVCLSVQRRHVSNALGRCIKIRRNRGSRVSGCSPNFWGGGAVLPQKFVDAVVEWRWWLFTGGNHQHSFVYALYQINTRSSAIAEGPRDASCPLKSCQLLRNSAETTYTTSPGHIDCIKLEI